MSTSGRGELFSDGLAMVAVEAGARYIGKTGAYAFEGAFDRAFPFSESMAVVALDRDRPQVVWALVDTTGKVVWRLEQ